MEITPGLIREWVFLFFIFIWVYFLLEIFVCRLIKKAVRSYMMERYEISKQLIAKEIANVKKG